MNGLKWIAPALIVVVVGGGLAGSVILGNRENHLLCEAVNGNRASLRNLLISARKQTPKKELTKRTKKFYSTEIAKIQPLDCANFDRNSIPELIKPKKEAGRPQKKKGGDTSPGQTKKTKQPP